MSARQAVVVRSTADGKLRDAMRAEAAAHAVAVREQRSAENKAAIIATIELNTVTAEQLAQLRWLGADVAQQILTERTKRRFDGWTDLLQPILKVIAP